MARDPFGALGQAMSYSGALSRNLALGQQAKQRRQRMVAEGSLSPLEAAQSDYSGEWDPFFEALQQKEEETNAAGGNFRVNWSGFGKPSEDYMPRRGDSRVYGALGDYGDERGGGPSFFDRESLKNQALNEASNEAAMRAREQDRFNEDRWRQQQQQLINDSNTTYMQHQMAQALAPPMQDAIVDIPDGMGDRPVSAFGMTSSSYGPAAGTKYEVRPSRPETDQERALGSTTGETKLMLEDVFQRLGRSGRSPAYLEYRDAVDNGYKGTFSEYQTEDANRKKPGLRPIITVDEKGQSVTKFVPVTEGESYVKPVGATTDARVRSAETVNRISEDLVSRLGQPELAKQIGPAIGRYNNLREFIGNPPPEFAELAGEIESFALANMGVHGMRSVQGANQIKELLDGRHTPESLAAAIRGISRFSKDFAEHNKPTSAAPSTKTETPEERFKRLGGGT